MALSRRPSIPGRGEEATAAFLSPDDPVWPELLTRVRADVYHLPGYVALSAHYEGGEPLLFLARRGNCLWLLPLIVRRIAPELAGAKPLFDAVSPYGYPGPLVHVEADADPAAWWQDAVGLLRTALAERGIVALFVRLHPLLPLCPEVLSCHGAVVVHGNTVFVDLAQTKEELWQQTRRDHRADIRSLQRKGFVARMDDGCVHLNIFRTIYDETMRRVRADDYYFFDDRYYDDLKAALGGRLHLCFVSQAGEICCAGLFTEMNGIVQFHLSGTRNAYMRDHPSKLMLHFMRGWGKERGNEVFHLGGGLGGSADSLLLFKQGFSKQMLPFHTWRLVVDPAAYARLVESWSRCLGDGEVVEPLRGYFPAYRRPLRSSRDA